MPTSSSTLKDLSQRYEEKRAEIVSDYLTFLRFASISSEAEFRKPLLDCLAWLKKYLESMPLKVEAWQTEGHPILFASYDGAGPDKPTLLIYNHYDVQPVDPLSEWTSPPFEPTIRKGEVYARGAEDNKGQCFYVIQALKALFDRDSELPLNIKLCIEGEEEIGSAGLANILPKKAKSLAADYLLIVDVGIQNMESPSVSLGVRGIVTMEVSCQGSSTDMHSGMNGGIVYNPIHALVEILSKLRDPKGKVTVPHFYDHIEPISPKELQALDMSLNLEQFKETFDAETSGGEKGLSPLERAWLRPTLEINGITGGYSGPGFKTVIPAVASAKISCRLVPNQDPMTIGQQICSHISSLAPQGIKVTTRILPGIGAAVRVSPTSALVDALASAFTEVFKRPCARILAGGSIPIAAKLQQASGAQIILIGLGLPGDCVHAPNEHFGLDRLEKGHLIIARAIELLASL